MAISIAQVLLALTGCNLAHPKTLLPSLRLHALHMMMTCAAAAVQVHNISDILGGFLVAIIFTTPFAIKAIGLHGCIKHLIDGPPASSSSKGGGGEGRPTHPAVLQGPSGSLAHAGTASRASPAGAVVHQGNGGA